MKEPPGKQQRPRPAGLSLQKFAKAKQTGYDKRQKTAIQQEQVARQKGKFRKLKARLGRQGWLRPVQVNFWRILISDVVQSCDVGCMVSELMCRTIYHPSTILQEASAAEAGAHDAQQIEIPTSNARYCDCCI